MDLFGLIFSGIVFSSIVLAITSVTNLAQVQMARRLGFVRHGGRSVIAARKERLQELMLTPNRYPLPWIVGAGLGGLLMILWLPLTTKYEVVLCVAIGYFVTLALGSMAMQAWHRNDWVLADKRMIAQAIVAHLPTDQASEILVKAMNSTDRYTRLAAVESCRKVVNEDIFKALQPLLEDPFNAVTVQTELLVEEIAPLMYNSPPLSVARLDVLLDLHEPAFITIEDALKMRSRDTGLRIAQRIIFSQFLHVAAYPHVYCRACYARATRFDVEDAAWLRCKVCKDAVHLVHPVREVIGQVGGVADWELEQGVLKINLWDAEKGAAKAAEVDRLEIVAGQPIDYNWAVIAVLDRLRNPHLAGASPVAIQFIGKLPLDENTLRMLQNEGRRIVS